MDIERFERGGAFLVTKRIGNPPSADDFASLQLPDEDLDDLRECRAANCEVKLSANALQALRGGANWINFAVRRGKLIHADIAATPPIPVSVPLVLAVHYSIGAVLVIGYLVLAQAFSPDCGSFVLALVYEAATTVFAWFFMLPAMGYGVAGAKAPREWRVRLSRGVGHLAGIAIFVNLVRDVSAS